VAWQIAVGMGCLEARWVKPLNEPFLPFRMGPNIIIRWAWKTASHMGLFPFRMGPSIMIRWAWQVRASVWHGRTASVALVSSVVSGTFLIFIHVSSSRS
jgi:hypothetical protein